jgi:hypothetical protein
LVRFFYRLGVRGMDEVGELKKDDGEEEKKTKRRQREVRACARGAWVWRKDAEGKRMQERLSLSPSGVPAWGRCLSCALGYKKIVVCAHPCVFENDRPSCNLVVSNRLGFFAQVDIWFANKPWPPQLRV